jgi:hypothetical protein
MNFPFVWRQWMMECVTIASTLILVNGSSTDEFNLERGLRQGSPPFLFLLFVECLNDMMNAMVDNGLISG